LAKASYIIHKPQLKLGAIERTPLSFSTLLLGFNPSKSIIGNKLLFKKMNWPVFETSKSIAPSLS
jgi:hypothetical protein